MNVKRILNSAFLRLFLVSLAITIGYGTLSNSESMGMKNFAKDAVENAYVKFSTPEYQLHYYIQKYSEMYGVPKAMLYRVARLETGYDGPEDSEYNPYQISTAGAMGPMQVMATTADFVWGEQINRFRLLYDIEFNIHTSVRYIKNLKSQYGSWKTAFGFYHTGKPIIDSYAVYVATGRNEN